jgi:diaminopimelate epimerase
VRVEVPGGTLEVAWDGSGAAFLTGPAVRVFDTEIEIPETVRA